jgi:putative transposase
MLFEEAARRFQWRCFAYCLMPNHYHLVIRELDAGLSAGVQYLNGTYAQWFNRRHDLEGHLFQGRFHSVLIESDWHLIELARYLALNPVRAGLCSMPVDWPWSSYGPLAGKAPAPAFLEIEDVLRYFGPNADKAREAFVAFVRDVPLSCSRDLLGHVRGSDPRTWPF